MVWMAEIGREELASKVMLILSSGMSLLSGLGRIYKPLLHAATSADIVALVLIPLRRWL